MKGNIASKNKTYEHKAHKSKASGSNTYEHKAHTGKASQSKADEHKAYKRKASTSKAYDAKRTTAELIHKMEEKVNRKAFWLHKVTVGKAPRNFGKSLIDFSGLVGAILSNPS